MKTVRILVLALFVLCATFAFAACETMSDVQPTGTTSASYPAATASQTTVAPVAAASNTAAAAPQTIADPVAAASTTASTAAQTTATQTTAAPPIDEQSETMFVFTETRYGYSVDEYIGTAARITVPASYKEKPVVELGPDAFGNNKTLLEVTLPDTITTIGDRCFYQCSRLYKINIPTSCSKIGKYALAATDVSEINIPAALKETGPFWLVNSPVEKIVFEKEPSVFVGEYFFVGTGPVDLTLPENKKEDHFDEYTVTQGTIRHPVSGEVPNFIYMEWKLKDTNRFFKATISVQAYDRYSAMSLSLQLFACDPWDAYRFEGGNHTTTVNMDYGSYGKQYLVERHYQNMIGNFCAIPSTLKYIEMPSYNKSTNPNAQWEGLPWQIVVKN